MRMRAVLFTALVLSALGSCRRDEAARPATVRERDSAIGASRLPGARGVGGALRASDSAAARRAREDSVGWEP